MKQTLVSVFFATLWISISEFVRNSILLRSFWVEHYTQLGLLFPEEPINGAVWGLWSFVFAFILVVLSKRFSFNETIVLSWVIGFLSMWLVIGNLTVLPWGILPYAIPLSMLEVYVACLLIFKLPKRVKE